MRRAIWAAALMFFLLNTSTLIAQVSSTSETIRPSLFKVSEKTLSSDGWPMFHQNLAHTGHSNSTAPNTNNILWRYKTDYSVVSSPAVADGKVFIGSCVKDVYALDEGNGTKIWHYAINGWVESSPAVAYGKVFVGGSGMDLDSNVYALDESTGNNIWSYTTGGNVVSSPAVADSKVFIDSGDGNVYALDEATGAKIWNYTLAGGSGYVSPAVADGKVFAGSWGGNVYALDENTGSIIWSYSTGSGFCYASPAVADGKVFIGSWDGNIHALDEATGAKIWNYTTGGWITSCPAVAGGKVFIGSNDGSVYALDENTGVKVWSFATGNSVYRSSPAVADGKVFIGSKDRNLYALDETTGTKIWNYTTGNRSYDYVTSSPAVADGKVFIGSEDNYVYAFGDPTLPPDSLCIEDIQPIQTLVNTLILTPGKPTVFKIAVMSTFSLSKTGIYLDINCGSQSWIEGPYTIKANQETLIYTGGRETSTPQRSCYCPSGEFDVTIRAYDVFNSNYCTETAHIDSANGYHFKDLGRLKVLYVPIGFWGGLYPGDPFISRNDLQREASNADSFTKAVFPVNPNKYTSEVGGRIDMLTPCTDSPSDRQSQASLQFAYNTYCVLPRFSQPEMGGYDRVVAVVPHRTDVAETWFGYWMNMPALGVSIPLAPTAVWAEEGWWYTPAHELFHSYTFPYNFPSGHCQGSGNGYWDYGHSELDYGLVDKPAFQVYCLMNEASRDEYHFRYFDTVPLTWICPECYATLTGLDRFKNNNDPDVLFSSGIVFSNDSVSLQSFYHFSNGYADLEPGNTGNYTLRFLDTNQQVLSNVGFNMTFEPDCNVTGFGFAVPYPSGTAQIQLLHGNTVIASRNVSANSPSVNLTYPDNGETLSSGENVTIRWQANDADNDSLSYTVLYSPDDGSSWIPMQTDFAGTSLNWTVPDDHPSDQCRVKVVATDGVNTGEAISNGRFTILRHDVSVADIQATKLIVGNGFSLPINVTVSNCGNYTETPRIDIYANETLINSQTPTLSNGSSTTILLMWNTAGFDLGNYTVSAYAWHVPNEIDTVDNNCTYHYLIYIGIAGDANGDGKVDVKDVYKVALAFGTSLEGPDPPGRMYNPNCDINCDYKVDVKDYYVACKNYGKNEP